MPLPHTEIEIHASIAPNKTALANVSMRAPDYPTKSTTGGEFLFTIKIPPMLEV